MQLEWHQLFDELKRRGHFSSDAQLADSLGLTRSQISAWRKNKSDLGTLTKIKILDALGHDTLHSAVLSLLPEKNHQELIKRHEQLVARVNRSEQPRDEAFSNHREDSLSKMNYLLAALPPDERRSE